MIVASRAHLAIGSVSARFVARGVRICGVNMQIGAARLLSLGAKWLILVVSVAMAMEHLGVGGSILHLAFSILYGGIVLGLALLLDSAPKTLSAGRGNARLNGVRWSTRRRLDICS